MKIRTKFTLLQLFIVTGFLGSMAFISIRFPQAYHLKQLELQSVELSTELTAFEKKTSLFAGRPMTLSLLWSDWMTTYQRVDHLYIQMLNNPYNRFLGKTAVMRAQARLEAWEAIKASEIKPLMESFESLLKEEVTLFADDMGINASRRLIEIAEGGSTEDSEKLAELENRFRNLRESLVSSILMPTESFISDLQVRVAQVTDPLVFTAIIIAVIIQTGGAFFSLRFSKRFSRNIILMERNLARVAHGNFDVNLEIQSGDEFEQISRHFNLLANDLWTRLDSMKDMMRDIGTSAGETTDMDQLEEFMLELAIDNTGADAGMLMDVVDGMLVPNKSQGYFPPPMSLPPMVTSKREYVTEWFKSHKIAPGEGLLGQIMTSGESKFIRSNTGKELPDNANPESDLFINSAIFIPLKISGITGGILALALIDKEAVFTDLDYSYMRSYGEFISMTMDNMQKYFELMRSQQINREIEVAADIQKTLLPEKMPIIAGAEVAAFSDAAKGVSGDYYDVFSLGDEKTALIICDVAGKGVPASLLMIMIRTIIRSISSPEKRSDIILSELNRAISGRMGSDRFATISFAVFDAKKGIVSYSNGAHHPLYILRGDSGRYRMFDTDGLPLGIDINASFGHKMIQVKKNDYLIFFTDGLPEARSSEGEELGTERLLRYIARFADQTPREMVRRVQDFIDDFTSGVQHDDQTFLALKVS